MIYCNFFGLIRSDLDDMFIHLFDFSVWRKLSNRLPPFQLFLDVFSAYSIKPCRGLLRSKSDLSDMLEKI